MAESVEEKGPESLLTLQLDTGEREFKDIEELQEWELQERSFFGWMEAGGKKDSNASQAWNVTNQWLTQIENYITQYKQHKSNPNQLEKIRSSIHNQIKQSVQKGHLLSSKNPIAIFGQKISGQEDEIVASYAVANLLDINSNQNSPKALLGAYLAFQYRYGSDSNVESQIGSSEALIKEWNNRFNERHLEIRSENESLIKEVQDLRDHFVSLKEDIGLQKEEQVTAFDELLENSKKILSDIAQTYDEKLALQASVQYWTDKRSSHTKVIKWMGIATLALAAMTGALFVYAAYELLKATASDIELWRLGVVIAISTFGIWITRLSAKIFISNLHLRTDADERVTMIQTYLALLREGSGPKDEERQLILQTLFRPSTTGFIKDDGPASFQDLFTKAFSKK